MIKTTRLPEEIVAKIDAPTYSAEYLIKSKVEKCTIEGIDEIQYLHVAPYTSIKRHGHNKQWEVWVRLSHKTAHVCLIGEEHELMNNSGTAMDLMAIKGNINYLYDDLAEFFTKLGFSVTHGSLVVNE